MLEDGKVHRQEVVDSCCFLSRTVEGSLGSKSVFTCVILIDGQTGLYSSGVVVRIHHLHPGGEEVFIGGAGCFYGLRVGGGRRFQRSRRV